MNETARPEIIYYAAVSLDGYIADPGGGVEFLDRYMQLGEDYGFSNFESSINGIIMGSGTYEKSLELAPWSGGDKPCWVFSLRNLKPAAPGVIITSNTPEQVVDEMYEAGVRRAWFMGGGKLASSFRRFDLLTEYNLALVPEILGEGIPLFEPSDTAEPLHLIDSKVHPSGLVQLRYRRRDD